MMDGKDMLCYASNLFVYWRSLSRPQPDSVKLSSDSGGEVLSTLCLVGQLRIVRQWKEYLKDLLSPTSVYFKQGPELCGWRELSLHVGRGCCCSETPLQ